MNSPGFLAICVAALMAVFFILTLLALFMITIIRIFPDKNQPDKPAFIAALSAFVQAHFPDRKITKIEEII